MGDKIIAPIAYLSFIGFIGFLAFAIGKVNLWVITLCVVALAAYDLWTGLRAPPPPADNWTWETKDRP